MRYIQIYQKYPYRYKLQKETYVLKITEKFRISEEKIKCFRNLSCFLPLEKPDPAGRQVVIVRTGRHNTSTTGVEELFKATHMTSDVLLQENEQMTVCGVVQIMDMTGVTAAHGLQMTPAVVKKAMTVWQVSEDVAV